MLKLDFDRNEIAEVIDRIVHKTMNMDLTWDWPCGVAYYGIAKAWEVTKNEEYLELLKNRVDEYMELGLPPQWTVNTCAMGHCLITLYEATGDEKYWDVAMSKVAYLRKDALRFGDCFPPKVPPVVSADHFLLTYNQERRQFPVRSVPDPEAGHYCLTLLQEEA